MSIIFPYYSTLGTSANKMTKVFEGHRWVYWVRGWGPQTVRKGNVTTGHCLRECFPTQGRVTRGQSIEPELPSDYECNKGWEDYDFPIRPLHTQESVRWAMGVSLSFWSVFNDTRLHWILGPMKGKRYIKSRETAAGLGTKLWWWCMPRGLADTFAQIIWPCCNDHI